MEPSFTIQSQREVVDLDAQGGPVRAMEVTFISQPSGTVGTVRVPITSYSAQSVRSAIEARVATIEDVHALGQS